MKITSTQFQQKVGYYLELVEQGQIVDIERIKPKRKTFRLTLSPSATSKVKRVPTMGERILEKVDKLNVKFTFKDGVKFQRKVRS